MLTWALLRSSGVISLALLSLAAVLGAAGPLIRRPSARLTAVAVHRTSAALGVLLVAGHVVLAVTDSWVDVSAVAVLVPGLSAWQPVAMGLGALALDLLVVLTVTSALRGRMPRAWWGLHRLAYPAWALALVHAFAAGTDRTSPTMLAIGVLGVTGVAGALLARAVVRDAPAGPQPARRAA